MRMDPARTDWERIEPQAITLNGDRVVYRVAGKGPVLLLVHGLAGSAAVALLVLATVRDTAAACGYLLVFGLGTILGMVLITVALTSPLALLADRFSWSGTGLRLATGLLSVGLGAWVMIQAGFVDGLFGTIPRWTPH